MIYFGLLIDYHLRIPFFVPFIHIDKNYTKNRTAFEKIFYRRIAAPTDTHIAVARFEGAEETIFASRCVSAVLSFAAHPFCLPLAELEGKMPLAADEV